MRGLPFLELGSKVREREAFLFALRCALAVLCRALPCAPSFKIAKVAKVTIFAKTAKVAKTAIIAITAIYGSMRESA